MKTLLLILLSFSAPCQVQNIYAKVNIRPSRYMSENIDSLFKFGLPFNMDSSKAPAKSRFYDVAVFTKQGVIVAYKINGKPTWWIQSNQAVMNAMTLSILWYLKQDIGYYRQDELYENRWVDHLQVFRKSDSTLLVTYTYIPKAYKIAK